jgi:uncharacterized protein (DUF2235 family)
LEARALAALIHRCGLLHSHLVSLEPYAMRLFQTAGNFPVVDSFKETFSRPIDIEFLGLWDTVTSMGNRLVARPLAKHCTQPLRSPSRPRDCH